VGELSQMVRGKGLSAVGFAVLAIFGLLAVLAPVFSPYAPVEMDVPMSPPSGRHLLGTDDVGHDILGELFHGARFSLLAGLISGALSTIIGIFVGLVAGYYERLGFAIMRIVDVFLAIPRFPLIVFLAAFLKPGLWTLVLVFVLFGWPRTSRLVRSRVLSERTSGYVDAARVVGADDPHIILRHLLPSSVPIALTRFIAEFQHVILAESGLSFLGLGDPATKSWGMMLHYAFQYPTIFISDVWIWWAVPPGLCITLVVLALTFSGFSLEEWANPRLRKSGLARRTNAPQIFTGGSPIPHRRGARFVLYCTRLVGWIGGR